MLKNDFPLVPGRMGSFPSFPRQYQDGARLGEAIVACFYTQKF